MKCRDCSNTLSKRTKGKLCRKCFYNRNKNTINEDVNDMELKDDDINISNQLNPDAINDVDSDPMRDRSFMDIIKEFMLKEKVRESEISETLKSQIDFLKAEIHEKNNIIKCLLSKIYPSNSTENIIPQNTSNTIRSTVNCSVRTSNRYDVLDDDSDSDAMLDNNNIQIGIFKDDKVNHKKHTIQNTSTHPKRIPGNSTYSHMTSEGKICAIKSDSMCNRIDMKEFNKYIKKGSAFRKTFPGATPKELHYYIAKPLEDEKPDSCVISVGQNRIGKDKPAVIVMDMIECANRCKDYGVNQVLVSSLTCRPGHDRDINEVNALLKSKQLTHDFTLIFNENIHASHIWRDDIHPIIL